MTTEVVIGQRQLSLPIAACQGTGGLIIGSDRLAIGTLVERCTRFTMLLHLPRMVSYGVIAPVKMAPP